MENQNVRWTPDARTAAAIKKLVDEAPPLSGEQVAHLGALLRPYVVRMWPPDDRASEMVAAAAEVIDSA